MIERFFRRPHVQQRLERGALASVVPAYLRHLEARGYQPSTIQAYVQAVEHFGQWLRHTSRTIADVDAAVVAAFLTRHLVRCRCRTPHTRTIHGVRAALHQLLAVVAPGAEPRRAVVARQPLDALVDEFDRHLRDTCGAMPATRHYYRREARDLLAMRFGHGPVVLADLQPADARAFVLRRAKTLTPASTNVVATAIGSFGRFLQLRGIADPRWTAAIPRAAHWRLAHVPRVLTDTELRAFLAAFDRTTGQGRRDYAIALCLLDLGLRAGDLPPLTLEAIDWHAQTLTLAGGKSRRSACLPLPARVARALADYLRHGRPPTPARALFVHDRPPRGGGIGTGVVRSAMRLAYARAGLAPGLTGTHVLRHTTATRLLRAGVSMKAIADVLRHRSLDTTALYAKVDLPALTTVALPWPEGRS